MCGHVTGAIDVVIIGLTIRHFYKPWKLVLQSDVACHNGNHGGLHIGYPQTCMEHTTFGSWATTANIIFVDCGLHFPLLDLPSHYVILGYNVGDNGHRHFVGQINFPFWELSISQKGPHYSRAQWVTV